MSPKPTNAPPTPRRGERGNDGAAVLTAEVVLDATIVVNDATLVIDADDDEGEVIIATPILPWWKQRDVYVLLGTVLVLLAAFETAIGVSSRNAASKGDVGDLPPEEGVAVATESNNITLPIRGSHGTCPSDDSAQECGATLEIWMDIVGWSIMNLVVVTENFALSPNRTERLIESVASTATDTTSLLCTISQSMSEESTLKLPMKQEIHAGSNRADRRRQRSVYATRFASKSTSSPSDTVDG